LQSKAVVDVKHKVVIKAHSDPTHQLHLLENRLLTDCRSNQVTAVMMLHLAGESVDMIASGLQWNPVSVKRCL
jgi:hypothetical protein